MARMIFWWSRLVRGRARHRRDHRARVADDGVRTGGVVLLLAEFTSVRAMAARQSVARAVASAVGLWRWHAAVGQTAALAAMWTAILFSSGVLARVHWGLAVGTIAMGAIGTLAILFGVRTAPEEARAVRRHVAIPHVARRQDPSPSRAVRAATSPAGRHFRGRTARPEVTWGRAG